MKKLSMSEINVITNVVIKKINEIKINKIKVTVDKDKDFKELIKLNAEVKKLEKEVSEKRVKAVNINNLFKEKYGLMVYNRDGKVDYVINYDQGLWSKVYDDLLINNINKELNVEEMIDKIVGKYK
jgi:rRNA maturation endonuclease Nob1